uniref:Uncharacterized protein n=1 Tax=Gouania willdenowi TaxID=441366 RepID=A0A8C5D4P5_GOUWI
MLKEPLCVLDMLSFFLLRRRHNYSQVSVTGSELFQWEMSKKINSFHPSQLHFTLCVSVCFYRSKRQKTSLCLTEPMSCRCI